MNVTQELSKLSERTRIENEERQKVFNESISDVLTAWDSCKNKNFINSFNEFLDNVMGKHVNSKSKWALNTKWAESKGLLSHLKDIPAPELLKKLSEYTYNPSIVSVGKEFAISTMKSKGYISSKHVISNTSIPAGNLFKYITKDHVNLVNNKAKRAAIADFVVLRDAYIKQIRDNMCTDIQVNIPVKTAKFSSIEIKNVLLCDEDSTEYIIRDDEKAGEINGVRITLSHCPEMSWNSMYNYRDVKMCSVNNQFDIKVISYTKKDNNYTYFNRLILSIEPDSCVSPVDPIYMRQPFSLSDLHHTYGGNAIVADRLITNYEDIVNHPEVKATIMARIKLYQTAYKSLYYLKTKHAGLIFLHGTF